MTFPNTGQLSDVSLGLRESGSGPRRGLRTLAPGSPPSPRAGSSSTCAMPSGSLRRRGGGVLVRERVRRLSGGVPAVRDQPDRPRAWPERRLSRRVDQEAFLVLGGECRLLVEGEERRLRAWDFFHSPPWTAHAFVGAGDRPCVILMVGAHLGPEARYPVSELAARYGASVEKETSIRSRSMRRPSGSGEGDRHTVPPALGPEPFAKPGGHSGTLAQANIGCPRGEVVDPCRGAR